MSAPAKGGYETWKQTKADVSHQDICKWVKERWIADPRISVNGHGGMSDRVFEVFGRRLTPQQLGELKIESGRERNTMVNGATTNGTNGQQQRTGFNNPVIKPADIPKVVAAVAPPEPPKIQKPGATKSMADATIRRSYALNYLKAHPNATNEEIGAAVLKEYGMGVGYGTIGDLRRELDVGIRKRRAGEMYPQTKAAPLPPAQNFVAPNTNGVADNIRAAIQMLRESVPNLQTLSLTIVNGEPTVKYTLAVVTEETVTL